MTRRTRPALGVLIFFVVAFGLGAYITFAAVQGDYGLFRRAEIEAESRALQGQLDALEGQVARMENLTRRLSDEYLDCCAPTRSSSAEPAVCYGYCPQTRATTGRAAQIDSRMKSGFAV